MNEVYLMFSIFKKMFIILMYCFQSKWCFVFFSGVCYAEYCGYTPNDFR